MDFRVAPAPWTLTWSKPTGYGKTKTAGATFHGRKIVIQTPCFPAKMFRDGHSTTVYLRLRGPLGEAFANFVDSFERYASTEFEFGEVSSCLRNGSLRISVWDDAQWFDEAETHVPDPETLMGMTAAACLLEFGGCWITGAGRWGLKWRAMQIRAAVIPTGPPTGSLFLDDDTSDAPKGYAFIEDDPSDDPPAT